MAGYSGTPLAKKLGIGEGAIVFTDGAPVDYPALIAPLPDGVQFAARFSKSTALAHLFVTKRVSLAKKLTSMRKTMRDDATIWVSWPKKASKVATDVTEDTIREIALPLGLVDVKVCAVDDTWSGLKLVLRRELRHS